MTWNPESVYHVEQVNITATIDSRSKAQTGLSGFQSKYRTSDGNTYGEWELPEVAPLVFPALDHLAAQESADAVKKKNKIASGMTFAAEYWDKRATAEYVSLDTSLTLSAQKLKTSTSSGRQKPQQRPRQRPPRKILLPLRRPEQPCSQRFPYLFRLGWAFSSRSAISRPSGRPRLRSRASDSR